MRIILVGPGALGCLLASRLASVDYKGNGPPVTVALLDHNPDRAGLLRAQGITLEAEDSQHRHIPVFSNPAAAGPADILLFCVKSPALRSCLENCRGLISDQSLVVFLQNGIDQIEIATEARLPAEPAVAVTSEGATLLAPGHVLHAGRGMTRIGFLNPPATRQQHLLQELLEMLHRAGLEVEHSSDIRRRLWDKLLINAGINPLTALYNRTNGQILTSCAARGRLKKIIEEGEAVARASGITISDNPVQAATAVCKKTARNISSMLQDRRNKRPTEIGAINGAIVRAGKRVGIPTPLNEEVVAQIREMEQTYYQEATGSVPE